MLVNTVGSNLDLSFGQTSRAILNRAGDVVQQECRKHGTVREGSCIITQSGKLKTDGVKHLYHCILQKLGEGRSSEARQVNYLFSVIYPICAFQ